MRFTLPLLGAFLSAAACHASITGPDGLQYPDWTRAGINGGIPAVASPAVDLTVHGADLEDDAAAIEEAAASLTGGGVVNLGAGTYYLDRPVVIRQSGVVLRGAGQNATRIVFRWNGPENNPEILWPAPGSNVYKNSWIQAFADPQGLKKISILVNGVVVQSASRLKDDEPICSLSTNGQKILTKAGGTGSVTLTVQVDYYEKPTRSTSQTIQLQATTDGPWILPNESGGVGLLGAITFAGSQPTFNNTIYSQRTLKQSAIRGSEVLELGSGHGFEVGDRLEIQAPPTERWNAETGNQITFGTHRANQYKVVAVNGSKVVVDAPLRIDFPMEDGAFVRQLDPIERCGIENLTLEQTSDLWVCGVLFSQSWECWAQNVTVRKAGRHPLYMVSSKHGEIRDCTMIDAGWKGHAGSAYVGWDQSYDCLMENVTTAFLRHAPLFQWGAAGNVIRNSTFYGSDAQFHAGYTHENLIENCVVLSNTGDGGYGGALYSASDTSHGVNGPRNVIYHCDFSAPNDGYYNGGAWFGGGNDDWMILHSRFMLDHEGAIYLRDRSRDHLFYHNVWAFGEPGGGVHYDNETSSGIEITGNVFDGLAASELASGLMQPALASDNTFLDRTEPVVLESAGFEAALAGWTTEGNGALTTTEAARVGTYGLRLTDSNTDTAASVSSAVYPVEPGQTWQARAWVRSVEASSQAGVLELQFVNASGMVLTGYNKVIKDYWTAWRRIAVNGDAPPNAAGVRVVLRTYENRISTVDYDGIGLARVPVALANPGFECGLVFWSIEAGEPQASADAAYTGGRGLELVNIGEAVKVVSRAMPVVVGETAQIRIRASVVDGQGFAVGLRFVDRDGALIMETLHLLPPGPAPWRQYVHRAMVPAGSATLQVILMAEAEGSGSGSAYFDDAFVLTAPALPEAPVPSIFAWQKEPNPALARGLDGTPIGLKFALGLGPDSDLGDRGLQIEAEGPVWTLSWRQPKARDGFGLELQRSTDLRTWDAVYSTEQEADADALVEHAAEVPAWGQPTFFRLAVP